MDDDRRHAAAWQDYIKSSLVGGGGCFRLRRAGVLPVYRELFEVILFYETLAAGRCGWPRHGPGRRAAALVLLLGLAW